MTSACLLHSSAPKNTRILRSFSTFGYLLSELAIESYRAPHRVLNAIFSHRTITFLVCNSPILDALSRRLAVRPLGCWFSRVCLLNQGQKWTSMKSLVLTCLISGILVLPTRLGTYLERRIIWSLQSNLLIPIADDSFSPSFSLALRTRLGVTFSIMIRSDMVLGNIHHYLLLNFRQLWILP